MPTSAFRSDLATVDNIAALLLLMERLADFEDSFTVTTRCSTSRVSPGTRPPSARLSITLMGNWGHASE